MPYQKKIGVLIRNTNVEDYFSPLKMFDYMASGKTHYCIRFKSL